MNKEKTVYILFHTVSFFVLAMLINGRSFIGLYIFGYRVGEYLTGFGILAILFVLLKIKYYKKYFETSFLISFILLPVYFLLISLKNGTDFTNLYLYKSSVFIWYTTYFFLGFIVFKTFNISQKVFIFGYIGLSIQYVFNVLYYPGFIEEFYNSYSDKTQFLKGSEIAIFFIIVTFFSNKYNKRYYPLDLFIVFSSIYFPLTIFKSRSAGLALGIFIIFEIYKYRDYFKNNFKKTLFLSIVSFVLFSGSSFSLIDMIPEFDKTDEAVTQVFKHKYVVSNTFDDEVPFIYLFEGRLYSADGNLNWRFQLWQDVVNSSIKNNEFLFGIGFDKRIPIFDNLIYSGLDGLNENTHNFLLNVYVRAGLLGTFLILYLFYKIIKTIKSTFSSLEFMSFFLPLVFISMFDGSMENPYFAVSLYFFLGSFFSGIKFNNRRVNL